MQQINRKRRILYEALFWQRCHRCHHTQMDGAHAGRFLELLQKAIYDFRKEVIYEKALTVIALKSDEVNDTFVKHIHLTLLKLSIF